MTTSPYEVINPSSDGMSSAREGADGFPSAMPAHYGLTTLTCVVIASMIGSGVFTTSGFAIGSLGSPARVLAAWCVGAVIAVCGAVSYGELARRLPVSGGEYSYLSRRLHPFMGFLAGWISLTAGFSGAIAMAAITFEAYAFPDSVRPDWVPVKAAAIASILVFGVGHAFLVRVFAALQNTIVGVKLLALAAFLVVVALSLRSHTWHWEPLRDDLPAVTSFAFVQAIAGSVMWISLSYAGFNAAVYVASEVRNPEVVVPRSLIIGTLLVTVLYLALNAVFVSAVPGAQIEFKKEVAAIAAKSVGGTPLELTIRFAIALGTLSSVAGMIMTGPRVFSRMADDGLFPSFFASGPRTTQRTVLFQMLIAVALVLVSNLEDLLGYLSTTLALSSAVTVATLFIPGSSEVWHLRKSVVICAAIYVLSTFIIAVLMVIHDYRDLAATVITLVIGTLLWLVTPRQSRPATESRSA